jgi:hypothetical protein
MNGQRRIPVHNRGPEILQIGLEPEGDWVGLGVGESLEVRYPVNGADEPAIELEMHGDLLSIHCMVMKEVWKDGQRIR